MTRLSRVAVGLILALTFPGGLGAQEAPTNSTVSYYEFQLRGNLVSPPVWAPGRGLLAVSDDRRVSLYRPGSSQSIHWGLPRRPQGFPAINRLGLALVPLGAARAALINLDGYLIRVINRPAPVEGSWLLDADSRIHFLGPDRIWALDHRGRVLRDLPLRHRDLQVEGVSEGAWLVSTPEEPRAWLLPDGTLRARPPDHFQPPWTLVSRPGSYTLEYLSSRESFVFEGPAALTAFVYFPGPGILAWGDERWKLYAKTVPAGAEEAIGPREDLPGGERSNDVKELGFILSGPRSTAADLENFFRRRMADPRAQEWLRTLIKDLLSTRSLIDAPSADLPANRAVLVRLAPLILCAQDASWLAGELINPHRDTLALLTIARDLGIDPQGFLMEGLQTLSRRSSTTDGTRRLIRATAQELGPSIPSRLRVDFMKFLGSLPR